MKILACAKKEMNIKGEKKFEGRNAWKSSVQNVNDGNNSEDAGIDTVS